MYFRFFIEAPDRPWGKIAVDMTAPLMEKTSSSLWTVFPISGSFGPLFFSSDFLFYMIYLIQLFHAFSQRREDVNHVME